jgi:formylglycine-generating enzyme required for sulfatase activity
MKSDKPLLANDNDAEDRIDVLPRIPVMMTIPAGESLVGTGEEQIRFMVGHEDWALEWEENDMFLLEQPQNKLNLPAFEIAKYPITNEAYYQFVLDENHRIPRGWIGLRYSDEFRDHPVTWVSWQDAQAYVKWINERTEDQYRLPTEAEWEKAARGLDARIYPWGDNFDPWRCNTMESGKRQTTQVGIYSPGGDSIWDVCDLIGNVWEWTSSLVKNYPYEANDGREDPKEAGKRIVRGGAWYYSRKLARCSSREGMLPDNVSNAIGFRLARSL